MNFASDIHGAWSALSQLAGKPEPLIILGDFINLTDYRTGEGAVAEVLGMDLARLNARARARGDYAEMRTAFIAAAGDDLDQIRERMVEAYSRQYAEVTRALEPGSGLVIHGNVDRPSMMAEALPDGFRYAHGEVVEVEGWRLGLVGGGIPTPLGAEGEIPEDEMSHLLTGLGPVDVLGTHIPPALSPLRRDVITAREERGSLPVLDYIRQHQPRFHIFGDIHQAQATTWRIGATTCMNVGYFRATGRYLHLDSAGLNTARVG